MATVLLCVRCGEPLAEATGVCTGCGLDPFGYLDGIVPTAWIHEATCCSADPCRICLIAELYEILDAGPVLALPEGEADSWRRYRDRCTVRGPWPTIEAQILAQLTDRAWRMDDRTFGFWPAFDDDPGLLEWEDQSGGWARIRVTVEVLDGVL
jgi:hypothetical protein